MLISRKMKAFLFLLTIPMALATEAMDPLPPDPACCCAQHAQELQQQRAREAVRLAEEYVNQLKDQISKHGTLSQEALYQARTLLFEQKRFLATIQHDQETETQLVREQADMLKQRAEWQGERYKQGLVPYNEFLTSRIDYLNFVAQESRFLSPAAHLPEAQDQ